MGGYSPSQAARKRAREEAQYAAELELGSGVNPYKNYVGSPTRRLHEVWRKAYFEHRKRLEEKEQKAS